METKRPRKQKASKRRPNAGTSKRTADEKMLVFVEAYLSNGGNATKASIDAGYSPASAASAGSRMLRNVKVKQLLDERQVEIAAKLQLDTERTLQEVARIAFADPRKLVKDGRFLNLDELDDDTAAAIASCEVDKDGVIKYKFWDKNSALERASKIQGLFAKDNKQKADPLADLLGALSGNVFKPVSDD